MQINVESQFFLREDFVEDIHNNSFVKILKDKNIPFTVIKEDLIKCFEEAVRNNVITNDELVYFLENEIRYGHNRTLFYQEIDTDSVKQLQLMSMEQIASLIESRGLKIPKKNNLVGTHLPAVLTMAEFNIVPSEKIYMTFIETIKVEKKTTVSRCNNYYFVEVDLLESTFSVRMRPRSNEIISEINGSQKVSYINHYYRIRDLVSQALNITLIDATHYKTTLYKIARELTEKAEEKWRKEVESHLDIINNFADEMKSKLTGLNEDKFDLNFRLQRLLERALIQSNFKAIKENQPGKKGYVHMFNFSDRAGGKIKASSKERDRAIELSEIYYDTRDTIDKEQKFDILWSYWFTNDSNDSNKTIYTKIEANSEFFQIHFYKYLMKDDLNHVLSKIRTFM